MRVLIVDDEQEIREGLKTKFPWADYGIDDVATAEDGELALAAALELKPELIVTDIKMKRMNGLEFIQALAQERGEGWRSIVISGYDDFAMVRQAMKLGAMDYVLKPINIADLGEVVRKAISQLEREQLERTNQSLMDSHVQNAMAIMREELLREMVEQPYSAARESRIVHRLQTLQMDWMLHDKLAVMVMEADDLKAIGNQRAGNEKDLILFGVGNVVKQTLEEDTPLVAALCQDAKGRWVVIVSCPDPQAMERCMELAQLCIDRVNRFVKVKVSIGLCSLTGSYSKLHHLFMESSGILEQKAVFGGNRLLTSRSSEEEATQDKPSIRNPDEVLDLIRYGSDEDIAGLMDGFVEMVHSWSLSHIRDVHQQLFEWLLHVYRKAAQLGWQDRGWERNPIALWEQLEQYDTLESLRGKAEQLLLAVAHDFRSYASSPSQIIQEADKYIAKHYAEGLTLQSVAAEVHVTPVWLSKLFKKEKGKTFLEHVTDVRMEHAKRMLSDVQFKIYQVASGVGYKDPVHFTKLFKKHMGLTPKEFRNLQGIADD